MNDKRKEARGLERRSDLVDEAILVDRRSSDNAVDVARAVLPPAPAPRTLARAIASGRSDRWSAPP